MIFHFFWTILKSKTNSKKANKSSNTKQDILDIDIKKEYRICFNTADGSEIQFVLRKNILCNTENDTRIRLSKKQIEELLVILN